MSEALFRQAIRSLLDTHKIDNEMLDSLIKTAEFFPQFYEDVRFVIVTCQERIDRETEALKKIDEMMNPDDKSWAPEPVITSEYDPSDYTLFMADVDNPPDMSMFTTLISEAWDRYSEGLPRPEPVAC